MEIIVDTKDIQTNVEDLCGDSIGVKIRKKTRNYSLVRNLQQLNPARKQTVTRGTPVIYNKMVDPDSNIIENKKKHVQLKKLIEGIKQVINH